MRVQYGLDELQILQTNSVDMRPVFDPTGTDYLYSKITLDVSFVWHPYATATNIGAAAAAPFDPLAVSVRQLRERLNYPRQTLLVSIANQLVWSSPDVDANNLARRLPCDVSGAGPIGEVLSLTEIMGEYGAMGRWRISFHKKFGRNSVLLSNRWSTRSITNPAGLTTRIVSGFAQMRADLVGYFNPCGPSYTNIDDFRNWMLVPTPAGFVREPVDVTITEKGDKCKYTVTDVEDPNPMGGGAFVNGRGGGADIGATSFDSGCTTGSAARIKSWSEFLGKVGKADISALMQSLITDNMAMAWAKVWGGKAVKKTDLLDLALRICLDRMNNGNQAGVGGFFANVFSVTVSQGGGKSEREGRWIKAEIAWRPGLSLQAGEKVNIENVRTQVNYLNDVAPINPNGQLPGLTNPVFPGDIPRPIAGQVMPSRYHNTDQIQGQRAQVDVFNNPICDGGSRGSWMGQLIAQALQTPFDPNNTDRNPAPAAKPPVEKQFAFVNKIV